MAGRLIRAEHARYWILLAILAVSTAAILLKLSDSHPLAKAFWRLLIAWVAILPFALGRSLRHDERPLRGDVLLMVLAGLALGVHFASWIWSFEFTRVSTSVLLVTTHPILVAGVSVIAFKERLGRWAIIGIAVALLGSGVIVGTDVRFSPGAAIGDVLAIIGAAMAGIYILLGSRVRKRVSLPVYAIIVYGTAMLLMLAVMIGIGENPVVRDPMEYLIFAGLAFGPMIVGHTLYNWALGYVSPTLVSVSLLGEPVVSTILAILILSEFPSFWFYPGAPLVLIGIFLVARDTGHIPDENLDIRTP
jgi:drug/metabolite transporter (DMT)-like permease